MRMQARYEVSMIKPVARTVHNDNDNTNDNDEQFLVAYALWHSGVPSFP